MMKQRVVVGLSGGVDSSVAAAMLVEQGYAVIGAYLTCWEGPGCRSEEDRQDALDVALQLKIPFVHLDFQKAYKERVYEYMVAEYAAGRTPNPDVMCNREIKFGLFYDWAMQQGYDFVATGHYAQIGECNHHSDFCSPRLPAATVGSRCGLKNQNYCLLRSVDEKKDQTYFLYQLRQEQLAHILFPIGHLTKRQVRIEAKRRGLLTAKKPDSQGICFIGEVSVAKFLEERIAVKTGKIILDPPGGSKMEVGEHRGVWFYTVGQKISVDQRKLKVFDQTRLPHFYVRKKDVIHNELYIGTREQLFTDRLEVETLHWMTKKQPEAVRIRHGGELVNIKNITISRNRASIALEQPVWGVAPGQMAVLYAGGVCLGGGVISG